MTDTLTQLCAELGVTVTRDWQPDKAKWVALYYHPDLPRGNKTSVLEALQNEYAGHGQIIDVATLRTYLPRWRKQLQK